MRLVNEKAFGIACIYEIKIDNKESVYVGSTNRCRHRFREHRRRLRLGSHHCRKLQNAYNKYGEQSLEMRIVKVVQEQEMLREEQRLVDFYGKSKLYNSATFIERGGYDPKPIFSVDPQTGDRVEFQSVREAVILLRLNEHAGKNIRQAAKKGRVSFGRLWSYDNLATIDSIKKHQSEFDKKKLASRPDRFFSFLPSGHIAGRYKSITHASESTGIPRALIYLAVHAKKYRTAGGMTWNDRPSPKDIQSKKTKPVFRIDKAGQLTWFDSFACAANQTAKASINGISSVVNGRIQTHAGYRWAFAKT